MSKYFAIFAAPNHADSFELAGVLTGEADAKQFATRLEQSGKYQAVAPPEHLEMHVILDQLVKDRLRELAEPIQRLAASVPPNKHSTER